MWYKSDRHILRDRSGAALIIVLAFVVLLLVLGLAYFSRTVTDRQVAQSSFRQTNANQLASSASDVIIADLKQEIINGSTASTDSNGNNPIYTPKSNANMPPMRSGNPSGAPDPIPNLVRRSWANDTNLSVRSRASAVNSTATSLNGRSVTPARWNSHYLIPRLTTSDTTVDSTPVASFVAPDWVFVTDQGPTVIASPTTSVIGRYAYAIYDEGGLIDVNVAGFPYAIPTPPPPSLASPQPIYAPSPPYTQGNSPTYPTGYTATTYTAQKLGRKGTAAFADLSVLAASGSTFFPPAQVNNLIGWRNYASAQPGSAFAAGFTFDFAAATRYCSVALSNLASFLQTSGAVWNNATDQAFASRQDLLAFRTSTQFSQNLLQYLGTFSREFNRPSWKPATTTAINPDLSGIRVTSAFTRLDGTAASQGEPLLKNRFPLRRLSWLTYKGPSATRTPFPPASPTLPATDPNYDMWQLLYVYGVPPSYLAQGTAENIKAAFGLVWDTRTTTSIVGSQWVYTSPSSSNSGGTFNGNNSGNGATVIKTLTTVQSENREPDFFELLKATILNGSVGLGSGDPSNPNAQTVVISEPKYYSTTNGTSADFQIMQIGANIIDSWDVDNIPTFIGYSTNNGSSGFATQLAGVENLPYLNKLVLSFFFNSAGNTFYSWLVPSLWNPHQNASAAPANQDVRFSMAGGIMQVYVNTVSNPGSGTPTSPTVRGVAQGSPNYVEVKANMFGTPSPPTSTNENGTPVGFSATLGSPTYDGITFPPLSGSWTSVTRVHPYIQASPIANFQMQVLPTGTGTIWRPYQSWNGCSNGSAPSSPIIASQGTGVNWTNPVGFKDPEFVALDPRTVRFGVWGSQASDTGSVTDPNYNAGAEDSLDQAATSGGLEGISSNMRPLPAATFPMTSAPGKTWLQGYFYANNDPANATTNGNRYADLDGVTRAGDWTTNPPHNGTSNTQTIMYGSAQSTPPGGNYGERPQILSQPFQSVAELGQVFRDQPWKTLAFTISNSGDAGLLDAFSLQDVPETDGRISLNSRQYPVIAAILSQVSKQINGGGVIPTSSADQTVNNIAKALVNLTTTTPMISKGDLVAWLAGDASVTGLGNKEARESVMRALSDAGQTRTWNLMIDVIAQSGRYPPSVTANPNAANLPKFVVEGEQRYWVHVAIDRFTGQVIDRQVEPVNQ